MRTLGSVQGAFTKMAMRLAAWRQGTEFACGECERWERCGLPPSEKCIVRAAQLARKNEKSLQRANPPHWWGSLG